MNDEQVNELLDDLDRALAVQPSPQVAARIRTTLAAKQARSMPWWKPLGAAAALGAVVVVSYASWPTVDRTAPEMKAAGSGAEVVATLAAPATEVPASAQDSSVSSELSAAAATTRRRNAVRSANAGEAVRVPREPEVLVSPDVRIAFEQLRTEVARGRVTAASFSASRDVNIQPTMITPTLIVIPPAEGEVPQPSDSPAGRMEPAEKPLVASNGRWIRTRSTL